METSQGLMSGKSNINNCFGSVTNEEIVHKLLRSRVVLKTGVSSKVPYLHEHVSLALAEDQSCTIDEFIESTDGLEIHCSYDSDNSKFSDMEKYGVDLLHLGDLLTSKCSLNTEDTSNFGESIETLNMNKTKEGHRVNNFDCTLQSPNFINELLPATGHQDVFQSSFNDIKEISQSDNAVENYGQKNFREETFIGSSNDFADLSPLPGVFDSPNMLDEFEDSSRQLSGMRQKKRQCVASQILPEPIPDSFVPGFDNTPRSQNPALGNLQFHQTSQPKISFICKECNLSVKSAINLKKHMLCHREGATFRCTHCNAAFIRKRTLTIHAKQCGDSRKRKRESSSGVVALHSNNNDGGKNEAVSLKCNQCPKLFFTKSSVLRHISIKHDRIKRFQCNICKKWFSTKSNLEVHQLQKHQVNAPAAIGY